MTNAHTTLRDIDKRHYNYFQALYLSFFSNRLYIDVGRRWKGLAITYLLLVCLIVSLPFALRMILNFDNYFDEKVISPLKNLPPLYIQNGQVSLDKPMPYFVKDKAGRVVSIIDTTGTIKRIDNKYPDLAILIVQDGLYYRLPDPQFVIGQNNKNPPIQINKVTFDKNMNQFFDSTDWVNSSGIRNLKLTAQIIIYPIIVLALFSMYLVFFMVIAVLGQVMALAIFRYSITYPQALRLLIVAGTPHLAILMIALAFDWMFMSIGLFLVIVVAAYFSYAVLSLKRDSTKLVNV